MTPLAPVTSVMIWWTLIPSSLRRSGSTAARNSSTGTLVGFVLFSAIASLCARRVHRHHRNGDARVRARASAPHVETHLVPAGWVEAAPGQRGGTTGDRAINDSTVFRDAFREGRV